MKNIIVTGSGGQMGQQFQRSVHNDKYHFFFFGREELDILSFSSLQKVFEEIRPACVINFAAYTDVEKAESEEERAYQINVIGTKNLAILCKKYECSILHLSTDYVFDGEKEDAYVEEDIPNPINFYGKTKLLAEEEILKSECLHVILRVAWVYSNFGHNFFLKMLQASQKSSELNVVDDQWGSPTSAKEICRAIDSILEKGIDEKTSGIYHFSPMGRATWKDFAIEIFKLGQIPVIVNSVPSKAYVTNAQRPKNSFMSCRKFIRVFGYCPMHWKNALAEIVSEKHISPIKVGSPVFLLGEEYVIASVDWSKREAVLAEINNMQNTLYINFDDLYV